MKNVLDQALRIDLKEVSPCNQPIGEGEKVIGTLPDNLLRLREFSQRQFNNTTAKVEELKKKQKEVGDAHEEAHKAGEVEPSACFKHFHDLIKICKEIDAVTEESKAIGEIFWKLVRLEFDLLSTSNIGVRVGGQVVVMEEKSEGDFGDLAELFAQFKTRGSMFSGPGESIFMEVPGRRADSELHDLLRKLFS